MYVSDSRGSFFNINYPTKHPKLRVSHTKLVR